MCVCVLDCAIPRATKSTNTTHGKKYERLTTNSEE